MELAFELVPDQKNKVVQDFKIVTQICQVEVTVGLDVLKVIPNDSLLLVVLKAHHEELSLDLPLNVPTSIYGKAKLQDFFWLDLTAEAQFV